MHPHVGVVRTALRPGRPLNRALGPLPTLRFGLALGMALVLPPGVVGAQSAPTLPGAPAPARGPVTSLLPRTIPLAIPAGTEVRGSSPATATVAASEAAAQQSEAAQAAASGSAAHQGAAPHGAAPDGAALEGATLEGAVLEGGDPDVWAGMLEVQRAPIAQARADTPVPAAATRWTVFEGTHALHPAVIPALLLLAGLAATGVLISGSGLLSGNRRRPTSLAPAPPTVPAAPPARPRPGDRIPRDVAAVLASIERGAAGRTPHPRGVRS